MALDIQVIWLAKDWWLLRQAANDLLRRNPAVRVGRLGGDSDKLLIPEVVLDGKFNGVVYTTLHTLYCRLSDVDSPLTTSLLIWDECHWAQKSKMGRKILKFCKKNKVPILGLTATPHEDDSFYIAFNRSFFDLVNSGWLAKPIIEEPVSTGIDWSPELNETGDFDPFSLRQLSKDINRNRLIAGHYTTNSDRYGQTLVFACNIEHANILVKLLEQSGVSVAPIHSKVVAEQRDQFLQEFRDGAIRVLVNVEMLTHGIDLPSVKSIFLCRPTTSDRLFAQMIGRGARRQKGKSDFYIVEFTDNVKNHIDLIISSKTYFKSAGSSNHRVDKDARRTGSRKQHHEFDPNGLPAWIPDDLTSPSSMRGLWFRRGQTFGIEFELNHPAMPDLDPDDPEWWVIATELLNAIRTVTLYVAETPIDEYAESYNGLNKDCSLWNVEYDSSVGWEVTSRILSDMEGYLEVDLVCEALDKATARLGLDVNYMTGTHVHLGWNSQSIEDLRRLTRLVRLAEPALGTLIAPSRLVHFNGVNYDLNSPNLYCKPITYSASEATIKSWKSLEDVEEAFTDRYVTLNLMSLFEQGTVEVRMHSGTVEARKILPWISLWQQILWAASVDRKLPTTKDRVIIQPDGDIVEFARKYLPSDNEPSQAAFLRRLDCRRREIIDLWRQNSKLNMWVEFRRNWKCAV